MPNIQMPDGQIAEFPDSMSHEDIEKVISQHLSENQGSSDDSDQESFGQKALRYGVQDPLIGLAKLGHGLINAPHNLASLVSDKIASKIPTQQDYDYSGMVGIPEDKRNLSDKLIQFTPDLFTSLALPETKLGAVGRSIERIPEAGKYIKTALANALSQGTYAAAMSPSNQVRAALTAGGIAAPFSALAKAATIGSPALKLASRLGLGLSGATLGYQGAKSLGADSTTSTIAAALLGAGGLKGLNAEESALKGVEGTNYKPVLDASRRLGLPYVTPAEASGNPFTGAEQGTIGKTEKGSQMLYEAGENRRNAEKKSISSLLEDIYNPSRDDQKKTDLYNAIKNKQVPASELEKFRGNPNDPDSGDEIFKAAESKLLNDPAYRNALKGIPRDSVEYLDMVKRTMGDMITPNGERFKKSLITSSQKDLVNTLENVAPEYKDARALAEREITRRNIENAFNGKEMTGTSFGKYLNNEKNFIKLKNNVRNVNGAQDRLNDMKLVFNRLINIPTAKSAEALSRSSMSKDRASSATAIRMLQELLTAGRYDKARVNLITDPKWEEKLKNLKSTGNTDKFIGKLYNLMGKAGGQSLAQ